MKSIGDLLERDLSQKIEEVIKVDQADEQSVYTEITEYVATDRIKEQYRELLKAMAEGPAEPSESTGVWISGFFGSGKSSFAKNLGYLLANREVLKHKASDLFKQVVNDRQISDLVDFINTKIPAEVVMFDVQVDKAVKKDTEPLAQIMYTVLLRELGYAQDFNVGELEIELEAEGKLSDFEALCQQRFEKPWQIVRKGAQKVARASALLHVMDPDTYPNVHTWAETVKDEADITVGKFVQRAFELSARRRPGKALVFVVDEVGQYVARSAEKIENLRALVEQFGKESKNRVKAGRSIAPTWIVITSQEKLDEIVAAIDDKRVELARLQDRFPLRIDLSPADIREVATKRVLAKKKEAIPVLRELFKESEGQLNAALQLERTARATDVRDDSFVDYYPYPPHFIELSIDIMSGIRLQPGAQKHLAGSNRTIIKQAYEMLVSKRTRMADQPVGTLVSLDRIFELVEGLLSNEKQKDIADIAHRFEGETDDRGMALRVAKALCLLEFVRDLPRTEANIAACLVNRVGALPPRREVEEALGRLEAAQFVRNTEEGWKLQTAQEKEWEKEKRSYSPKPKDRNDIIRGVLKDVFEEPQLRTYKGQRSFRVGVTVDGVSLGDGGDIPLALRVAQDEKSFGDVLEEAKKQSRQNEHQYEVYWVFSLTPEIDDLVVGEYRSRRMIATYDQLRVQNRISTAETTALQNEQNELRRTETRLREKVVRAIAAGSSMFRGVQRDGASLGKALPDALHKLLATVIPDLYPHLVAVPLKGSETEELLKAANLKALPAACYDLQLVTKTGDDYMVNLAAPTARMVLDRLKQEHDYGTKDTRMGKGLESHFGGIGYGWESDMLRLILAALFRGGAIDVVHAGRRFDSYSDPAARAAFSSKPAFRSAVFTPVTAVPAEQLKAAVEAFEELTGTTVEFEKNVVASALKGLAEEELRLLGRVQAAVSANTIPVEHVLEEYGQDLRRIHSAAADECVHILAGERSDLKKSRDLLQRIAEATDERGLSEYRRARTAATLMAEALEAHGRDGDLAEIAGDLRGLLESDTFYESTEEISVKSKRIEDAYRHLYLEKHEQRRQAFTAAVDDIKGSRKWPDVQEDRQEPILRPLLSRACEKRELLYGAPTCDVCGASIEQMESEVAALDRLKTEARQQVEQAANPERKVEVVRLSSFFAESIDSRDAVQEATERLKERLLRLLDEGATIVVE